MATPTDDRSPPSPDLVEIGVSPGLRRYFGQIWSKRDFALSGALGDLRAQNMNTVLGSVWHLLNPLLLAAVYYLVFGIIFGAGDDDENYAAFLVIGMFTFFFSQKSMVGGSRTVIANLPLIQSLQFPRIVLPFSAVMTEAVAQIPAIAMMLLLVAVTGEPVTTLWLLLPVLFVLQSLFNMGLAFVTARITFHFRDTQNLLPYVSRLAMYLSGIFYGVDRIPEGWARDVFALNPLNAFIEANRGLLMYGTIDARTWTIVGVWTVVGLLVGFWFFRGKEAEYGRGY